jgi:16S rRNA (cytosine1402-N4)-methyltransferase
VEPVPAASDYHVPVLLKEAINLLKVEPGKKYIDATLGGGGHSKEILNRGGDLLAIDRDPEAVEHFQNYLKSACPASLPKLSWGNFEEIDKFAQEQGFERVDGILFDLGVSSHQLETPERGFSFTASLPLDMRMDPRLALSAKDLINVLNEGELYELFTKLGEEEHSRRFSRAICRARGVKPIETCAQLAEIIAKAAPARGRLHPATKVFQALRIAVNDELNSLRAALPKALEILNSKGRIVIISFHSLEDRIVKDFFQEQEASGKLTILTKKPIVPSIEEVEQNPRARSAKLRSAERV